MNSTLSALALAAALCAPVSAQDRAPIVVEHSALNDLHHHIRAVLHDRADAIDLPGIDQALARAEDLEGLMAGESLAWAPVDIIISGFDSTEGLDELLAQTWTSRRFRGDKAEFQRRAAEYARALAPIEDAFLERHWPGRRAELERWCEWIDETIVAQPEAFYWHAERLGYARPEQVLTIVVVTETGWPGGFTNASRDKRASFVQITGETESSMYELCIHEMTHSLDILDRGEKRAAPTRIRNELRGVVADNRRGAQLLRNAWHTVYFIQSAMTTRRFFDETHVDYGLTTDLYERSGPAYPIQRRIWDAYNNDEISLDDAVEQTITQLSALAAETGE